MGLGAENRMTLSEVLIEAQNLTKKFDDLVSVDDINFQVFKANAAVFLDPTARARLRQLR